MKLSIVSLMLSIGVLATANMAPNGFHTGSFPTSYFPCYANKSATWKCTEEATKTAIAPATTEIAKVETVAPKAPEKQVFFEVNKFLPDQTAQKELDGLAQWMKANPTATAIVAGHADSTGTAKHNMTLSQKRAAQVKSYLQKQGVDSSRVSTNAYGDQADSERKAVVIVK